MCLEVVGRKGKGEWGGYDEEQPLCSVSQGCPDGFVEAQMLSPTPRKSDSAGQWWDLKMHIANQFPDATSPRTPPPRAADQEL